MNSVIYNIDFARLVKNLLPLPRVVKMNAWIKALIYPIVTLYQDFLRYRKAKNYQLMITPQVCYLERLLNDRYDFALRRILIKDTADKIVIYIYQEEELKPAYVYTEAENEPVYIYTDGESGAVLDDFYVLVPGDIVVDDNEMLSLLKQYKLAGVKPKIQRV